MAVLVFNFVLARLLSLWPSVISMSAFHATVLRHKCQACMQDVQNGTIESNVRSNVQTFDWMFDGWNVTWWTPFPGPMYSDDLHTCVLRWLRVHIWRTLWMYILCVWFLLQSVANTVLFYPAYLHECLPFSYKFHLHLCNCMYVAICFVTLRFNALH